MTVLEQALELLRSGKASQAKAILEAIHQPSPAETIALARSMAILGSLSSIRELLLPLLSDSGRLSVDEKIASAAYVAFADRRLAPSAARDMIATVKPLVEDCANLFARADWGFVAGLLEMDGGNALAAERLLHSSLKGFKDCDEELGVSWVCNALGHLLLQTGHVDDARAFILKSLSIKEKHQDIRGQAISHGALGRCSYVQDDLDEASREYHQDLTLSRSIGDIDGEAQMLCSLGELSLEKNDIANAERLFNESARTSSSPVNLAHAYAGLAMAAMERGDLETAQTRADESRAIFPDSPPWVVAHLTAIDAKIRADCGDIAGGISLIRQALEKVTSPTDVFNRIKLLYRLRDLLELDGQDIEAVHVMSEALDKLCLCGAEAEVGELRRWMSQKDNSGMLKLALSRCFPPFLVDDIVRGDMLSPLERKRHSRRQDITVLFTDIRDFTVISQTMAPDELLAMLSDWFRETTKIVQAHGGMVDKFVGDAMMALFGVPDSHDDAPLNACRAALQIQEACLLRNLRREALGNGTQFHVGVGVSRGDAVVGFLGSHLRLSFTAIGATVNLASRLESATKEVHDAHILVSEGVANDPLVRNSIDMTAMPAVDLKGIGPTPVWSVTGLKGE